jgi:hypothetical protein
LLLEADNGFSIIDANGVKIEDVKLITKNKTGFEFLNSKNVDIKGLDYNFASSPAITVNGERSENITLNSSGRNTMKNFTVIGADVPVGAVKF